MRTIETRCAIAGGGPAGMMLGLLLARSGVDVVVLEKHRDFLRDFRGDTLHPSTLEVIHELGLLDELLALPHRKVARFSLHLDGRDWRVADFSRLRARCPYIAFMPQWDFLDFLSRHARRRSGFRLEMQAEVTGLLERDGRVIGLEARTLDGPVEVRCGLVVGADGRDSLVRRLAGLPVRELGAPMDILWFRLPKAPGDPDVTMGRFVPGRLAVVLDRGDYWQCGLGIRKGTRALVEARGLPALRDDIARAIPFAADRTHVIDSWDDVPMLSVRVDRLERWHRPGLLCIGDAAHAMSPVGGVGINLAIQDAVAAANLLAEPLRRGAPQDADLARVQRRRLLPTRLTQAAQVVFQERVVAPVLETSAPLAPPLPLRLLDAVAPLRGITARLIGLGVRPEHVRTPPA